MKKLNFTETAIESDRKELNQIGMNMIGDIVFAEEKIKTPQGKILLSQIKDKTYRLISENVKTIKTRL